MSAAIAHGRRAPYLLLAPFMGVFIVFMAYPIVQSLVLSGQQTFGPSATEWVGLSNYSFVLTDPLFWRAMANTAVFTLASVFIQLPLALGLALLVNRAQLRGRALFRLVLFAPVIIGPVFSAMLFSVLLEKQTGLVNQAVVGALSSVGLDDAVPFDLDFPWLRQHAMWAMILTSLWLYVGFNMVYFLAALQNVRRDLMEAAMLDGAGPWRRFREVTLPAIRPVGAFVVLLAVIGSFQLFELPWVMFQGTPGYDNRALTVVMYLYQKGFETGDLGLASAVGWLLTLVLVGFALVQLIMGRRAERGAS